LVLTAREGFTTWYSAFTMAHTVVGLDVDEMDPEMLLSYNSVIETMWRARYPSLTFEEIEELKEDVNMELMQAKIALDEAIESGKIGGLNG